MKYTFQVLLKAHDTRESSWYYPRERREFATADEALRVGVRAYPDHNVRVLPLVRPRGHQVRKAMWAILRGISDASAWRGKCQRCGMTGQAHWDPFSFLVCRRFLS